MRQFLKIFFILATCSVFVFGAFFLGYKIKRCDNSTSTENQITEKVLRPLDIYSIENLSQSKALKGQFNIKELLVDEEEYGSYIFEYTFDPKLTSNSDFKTITGLINIPKSSNENSMTKYPLILMLRGYVDQKIYRTGDGTRNSSKFFAGNGYITIAPDFLGYAQSDPETDNISEARFQTYTTTLSLLKTIESIDKFSFDKKTLAYRDEENLFLWGHSNGGLIALTLLEITKNNYPTVLWAPVSKPFPYSILYYTDESDDKGKLIRKELSKFEDIYNTEKYSFDNYLKQIISPLQIHQGTKDDAVPVEWTNNLVQSLEELGLDVNYFTYSGADHNLQPVWDTVIARDLEFFNSFEK